MDNSDDKNAQPTPVPPNARGQTGPRLPCGKAASSRNATKHGIFSHPFIERGQGAEDPADFRELLAETRQTYQPEGRRQDELVERIADAKWRLHRLRKFEIGAMHERIDAPDESTAADQADLDDQIAECEQRLTICRETLAAAREAPDADFEVLESIRESTARLTLLPGPKPTFPEVLGMMSTLSSSKPSGRSAPSKKKREDLRQELMLTLERRVKRDEGYLAQLQRRRDRAGPETDRRAERERLLYAIPAPEDAKLLIRYETMLTRDRDKAVKELDELQARSD